MLSWTDWIARTSSVMIPRYWCLYDVFLKSTWFLVADSLRNFLERALFLQPMSTLFFWTHYKGTKPPECIFCAQTLASSVERLNFDWDQETIETMAMMATWCVMCGLFAGQIHAKTMENEISHSDEGASFAPIILADHSDGDQEPGRIGWTLLIIVISFMFSIYSSPIPLF